jgi:hypothetical protein
MRELFGVDFLGDGGPRTRLECRVAQPDALGQLESFEVQIDLPSYARVSAVGATVVATDAAGNPLLTMNAFGHGRAVLMAAPVERGLALADEAADPSAVRTMLRMVYGAVARAAGCALPLECDAPDVELALFQGAEDDILLALSHTPERRTASITLARAIALVTSVRGGDLLSTGGQAFSISLGPNGTAALRVSYA